MITHASGPGHRAERPGIHLTGDVHFGPVSVVGSFNDWTPGTQVLEPQVDGTLSVRVTIDPD